MTIYLHGPIVHFVDYTSIKDGTLDEMKSFVVLPRICGDTPARSLPECLDAALATQFLTTRNERRCNVPAALIEDALAALSAHETKER